MHGKNKNLIIRFTIYSNVIASDVPFSIEASDTNFVAFERKEDSPAPENRD